ncbi:MAG: ABC transporter ATP-binding protein [Desulfobaccales bacterium]
MSFFEIKGLVKAFGGLVALHDINLSLEQGEIVGLIGPNGSGKTTLFNCINNFYTPDRGQILFKGQRIDGLPTHQICKLGIARTFQIVKPLKRLTVLDNVMAGAFLHTNDEKQAREKSLQVLESCELSHRRDMLGKELPIADKKRMEVARALASDPELLLLDETAAGLNLKEIERMLEIVLKIRQSGITCLVVEHVLKFLMGVSDRVMCINFGEEIITGRPQEVMSHPEVIAAYLGAEYATGRLH